MEALIKYENFYIKLFQQELNIRLQKCMMSYMIKWAINTTDLDHKTI